MLYKRLFGLLWVSNIYMYEMFSYDDCPRCVQYGSGKTLGAIDGRTPTYVYPAALKDVVRARYSDDVKGWDDPSGPQVFFKIIIIIVSCYAASI